MTALTGTWHLLRLAVRRDRLLLPAWIASIAGVTAAVVASVMGLYSSAQERSAAAAFSAANPVARIFDGPASGTDIGAMALVEGYLVIAILVAIMSVQAVVRHTRAEEEAGRGELLASSVVGHNAPLVAAFTLTAIANLLVGVAVTAALVANGLAFPGSAVAGATFTGVGLVFAGVGAVAAQVLSTSRAANGAGMAVLGVAFLLRAVGDVAGEVADSGVEVISAWPSWLSPIGWGQQVRPFHDDAWPVLGLFVAATVVLVAVAVRLTDVRDQGAGLVPPRPGAARGGPRLGTPLGLAWRQHRGVLAAWAIGLAVAGTAFGVVGEQAEEVVGLSDELRRTLEALAPEGGIVDLFFAFLTGFLGVAAAAFTVQTLLRARTEEASGRLEPVLATATSRSAWLGGHVAIAGAGTAVLLAVLGTCGALGYGLVTGHWAAGATGMIGGAMAQLPAALALGALVLAAVALLPRWAPAIGWAALAVSLVMGQLGALLELPQPVLNLSPFTHVPAVPAESFRVLPVAVLCGVTVALGAVGLLAFRARDLDTVA